MKPITFLLLLFVPNLVTGQEDILSALKGKLQHEKNAITKLKILDTLSSIAPDGEWEDYNEQMENMAASLISAHGADENEYQKYLAKAYNNKSIALKYSKDIKSAIKYGEMSLALTEKYSDEENLSAVCFNLGRLYHSIGNLKRALELLYRSVEISDKLKQDESLPYCLNYIGFILKEQGELKNALTFHNRALQLAQERKDAQLLGVTFAYIGFVLRDMKNYNECLDNFKRGLLVFEGLQLKRDMANSYFNIGKTYNIISNNDSAQTNLIQSVSIYSAINDAAGKATASSELARTLLKLDRKVEAEKLLRESLRTSKEIGHITNIQITSELLSGLLKSKGNYKESLEMLALSSKLKDSIQNEETRKTALNGLYRYEYEKKSIADSLRLVNEKQLMSIQLSQEKTQRYAWASVGVLLLGVIGFIFYRYRSKQKINELSLRNRIASDLHDEVGSAISSISIVAGIAKTKPEADIKSLVREIEETSRETIDNMADIVWSIEPSNDDFGKVTQRMHQFGKNILATAGIEFIFNNSVDVEKTKLNIVQRKNLYLIFKEAVNNAAKYSQAKKVTVEISKQGKDLVMQIQDDGKGFDVDAPSSGNGLRNLKRRAAELHANLRMTSENGKGALLRLELPL